MVAAGQWSLTSIGQHLLPSAPFGGHFSRQPTTLAAEVYVLQKGPLGLMIWLFCGNRCFRQSEGTEVPHDGLGSLYHLCPSRCPVVL